MADETCPVCGIRLPRACPTIPLDMPGRPPLPVRVCGDWCAHMLQRNPNGYVPPVATPYG